MNSCGGSQLCFHSTQLCTHTHMHSVSLLLSPGPTLNRSQREGLWGKEAAVVVMGGGPVGMVERSAERQKRCAESELLWPCNLPLVLT